MSVGDSGFKFRCDTTGLVSQYSGDLTGAAVADFTALINCKTGRETGHGTETFTGSLVTLYLIIINFHHSIRFAPDFSSLQPGHQLVAVKSPSGLQGRLTFTDTTFTGVLH